MRRFQALLKPDLTPKEEQERASRQLPDLVRTSRLHWWTNQAAIPAEGKALLLVVATWSHYDLALLDVLDALLARRRPPLVPIYVANLEQHQAIEQLTADIPAITKAPPQTPVVAVWEDGKLSKGACGKHARGLAADRSG